MVGCTGYPRYARDASITPKESVPMRGGLTTDEFIRLGMVMRKYLGKPYRGTSQYHDGLDCSLFTGQVFREFNKTRLPRTAAEQYAEGREIPRRRLSYGDLVFFRTERRHISHVGIYVGQNEFIHVSTSNGVIISNLSETYWADRYAGARRILE